MPLRLDFGPFDMSQAIVPLFAFDAKRKPVAFLGTGFFVGDDPVLVTAGHNVDARAQVLGIILIADLANYYPATILRVDAQEDVALLSVPGYRPEHRFALAPDDLVLQNELVLCSEYGTTTQAAGHFYLSVATRVGNVTRQIATLELMGKQMNNLLEVSFPALRGASGAPILTSQGFLVLGMLVANASYHLIPVQIEKLTDGHGQVTEETRFMMPQGIAVHVSTIRRVLDAHALRQ